MKPANIPTRRVSKVSRPTSHRPTRCMRAPEVLSIGDLELNQANHDVRRGGRSIQLSNKEYQLLLFLMRSPNKVQSRLEILHGVWGESFYGDDNLLDVYIRYLRQKVESSEAPKLIHTVRGVGFMMRLEET